MFTSLPRLHYSAFQLSAGLFFTPLLPCKRNLGDLSSYGQPSILVTQAKSELGIAQHFAAEPGM